MMSDTALCANVNYLFLAYGLAGGALAAYATLRFLALQRALDKALRRLEKRTGEA